MNAKVKLILLLSVFFSAVFATFISLRLALFSSNNLFNAGDYYSEVDPIILKFIESPNLEFYNSFMVPLMTPFSIVLRSISIFILEALGFVSGEANVVFNSDGITERYIAGAVTVVFVGIAAFLFALFVPEKKFVKKLTFKNTSIFIGFAALVALMVGANPLIVSSILWGHPEETLMAGLLAGSGLLFLKGKVTLGAVFLALAVATKQPALFAIPAAFFFIESGLRKKFVITFLLTFLVATVPFVISHAYDFLTTNILVAGGQDFNVPRGFEILSPLGLREWGEVGKPIIALAAFLIPFSLARLNQKEKSLRLKNLKINQLQFAAVLPVILVIRFAFDLGNISYYALPAGMLFVLLDYVWQNNENGAWRKSIKNPPFVFPIFSLFFSIFLAIVFYQEIFVEMGPDWRGGFTLIMIGFPLLAGILVLYQPVSKNIGKKQWAATIITMLAVIVLLSGYHEISNNENSGRVYKGLKEYSKNENMLRAMPNDQTGFWIGESPNLPKGRKLLYRGLDGGVVFNIYAPEGRRTAYFDYGIPGKKKSLEITTYNTVLADRKQFINQCLNKTGSCLGFKPVYQLPAGDAVVFKGKGAWEAYIKGKDGQTIYVKNSDPEITPQILKEIEPIS